MKPIIGEILSLALFNRLANAIRDEFGAIALGIVSRRSASGRTAHPGLAKVRRRDERINFADDDIILSNSARAVRLNPRSARFDDA